MELKKPNFDAFEFFDKFIEEGMDKNQIKVFDAVYVEFRKQYVLNLEREKTGGMSYESVVRLTIDTCKTNCLAAGLPSDEVDKCITVFASDWWPSGMPPEPVN
jgi:hypothetical protein